MNFSICLIVKNEEKKIEKCLSPLKDINQEIVVIDTGSTDKTVELAKKYTSSVYYFEWIQDFSAARNFAMEKAKNDFVFFLDADEYTEDFDIKYLMDMAKKYPEAIGQIKRRNKCMTEENNQLIYVDMVERFFNKKLFYYTGAIHEQVTSRTNKPLTVYEMNWTVFHDGYIGTPEELKAKGLRNAELLLKDLEKDPHDPYTYYQLGQSYELFNDYDNAYVYYKKGMELATDLSLKYIEIMTINYGQVLINKELYPDALSLDCDRFKQYKENADFVYMLATAARKSGNLVKAINYYKEALECKKSDTEGLNGPYSWHNLGCIYEALNNYEDALIAYKNAGSYPKSVERYDALNQKRAVLKMLPKCISIITIFSNGTKYIKDYLNALSAQTIGLCNLEFVFIDNNTDNSTFTYLEAFEKQHNDNVILMKNTENLSDEELYATAFSYTAGQYVLFTKDNLIPVADCLRLMYAGAQSVNSDFVKTNYQTVSECSMINDTLQALSDNLLSPNIFAIELQEGSNRHQIKQMRLLAEPLDCTLYKCDFIINKNISFSFASNDLMTPFEEDIYEKADYSFIIENICFIRMS